jgi:hypothetical protein
MNEEYIPQIPMYYNYRFKENLIKDSHFITDINEYENIILCVYKVNTNGKYPFLEFLLINDEFDSLTLPKVPKFSLFNKENLLSYSKVFLSSILKISNFNSFDENVEINGFYEYDKNLYLFLDVTNCEFNIDFNFIISQIQFALTDEILNHKKVCNIEINADTSNFFLENDLINYLYDKNNEAYEIPLTGFVGKPTPEKLNFCYTFGETAKDKSGILGPYYYFTDFLNSVRQGGWSNDYKPEIIFNKLVTDNNYGRYSRGGIVRFAIFTGQTKYIENMPNDENDRSEIKKNRLQDTTLDKNYEIQTLRISDHDGKWTKNNNSVYLGNIELDNGSLIKDAPLIVLKEYNQQIPLSYHFINKKTLSDKFEKDNLNYSIV